MAEFPFPTYMNLFRSVVEVEAGPVETVNPRFPEADPVIHDVNRRPAMASLKRMDKSRPAPCGEVVLNGER
jgi:hypothetical protein